MKYCFKTFGQNFRFSDDPNTVALLCKSCEKPGYHRWDIDAHIAPLMDHGRLYTASIASVLGH